MAIGDFLARLGGRPDAPEQPEQESVRRPPTSDDLLAALESTEALVAGGVVPSPVTARVQRVTATVRDTIPRLDTLGAGSAQAYSVMATATDYLPEAVGGYLRLPRRFADTRPVDHGKTALMVLVDQLDLLGATMDQVFDAVCRDDANALVAHGRFLAEKFGRASDGGDLQLRPGETVLPPQPEPAAPDSPEPAVSADAPAPAAPTTEPARAADSGTADSGAAPTGAAKGADGAGAPEPSTPSRSSQEDDGRDRQAPEAPARLSPPSSLDL